MVRHPVPISWLDEIISYYESDKSGQKAWYSRKMNALDDEQREQVFQALEQRGHSPRPAEEEAEQSEGRRMITWTDEEWDRLADLVWRSRKNDPTESLIGLCKRVMPQFAEPRRRNIRTLGEIKPLVERLKQRDEDALATADELQRAKSRIEQVQQQLQTLPSREEVLGTLTDEEAMNHYGQRIIAMLSPDDILKKYPVDTILAYVPTPDAAAHVIRHGMDMFFDTQRELASAVRDLTEAVKTRPVAGNKPSIPMPRPIINNRLPKVTIVGLLADQQNKVESRLKGRAVFNFVDKNRKDAAAIPDNQDIVLLAANFISHSTEEGAKRKLNGTHTRLIVHHGGIDTLVRKLDGLLPQAILA